jgi:hypothetical protein
VGVRDKYQEKYAGKKLTGSHLANGKRQTIMLLRCFFVLPDPFLG